MALTQVDVLNRSQLRCAEDEYGHVQNNDSTSAIAENAASTNRVLMYMFPRQFGLHNAFTSKVDFRETSQRFKDYTLREEEISLKVGKSKDGSPNKVHVPKRLRGMAIEMVRQMQKQHQRCSYSKLIEHYCPVRTAFVPSRRMTNKK